MSTIHDYYSARYDTSQVLERLSVGQSRFALSGKSEVIAAISGHCSWHDEIARLNRLPPVHVVGKGH